MRGRALLKKRRSVRPYKKILLCNIAHLGDVVLSTSLFSWISSCYPEASISFLAGSWSKDLLIDHIHIDKVHTIDHWKLDRSSRSLLQRVVRYRSQRKKLIQELKEENYDLAIDLYPFFPNAIPWLSKANIPVRLGFTSGGFGPSLTHPVQWSGKKHMVRCFSDLLLTLPFTPPPAPLLPCLSYTGAPLCSVPLPKKYCLFHVGSGDEKKEWSVSKWQELVKSCKKRGIDVVFSGRGEREKKMIIEISQEGGMDLCDRLSLRELMQVIQKAEFVVTVDSVTGHLASAFAIPAIVLFSGMNDIEMWAPVHAQAKPLFTTPSCFPCLKKGGVRFNGLHSRSECQKGHGGDMQPWFVTFCGGIARVIGVVSRLFFLVLLLRYLGVELYAMFAVILSLEGWLALSDWGLGSSAQNAVSQGRVLGENDQILFRSVAQLCILFLLFSWISALCLSPFLYPFLFPQISYSASGIQVLCVAIGAYSTLAVGSVAYRVLYAKQKGYWVHVWQTVGILFSLGSVVYVVYQPDLEQKLLASVLGVLGPQSLVALCVFLTLFYRYFDFSRWDWEQIKSLMIQGLQFLSFGIGAIVVLGIDYIVMSRHLSPDAIVVYHIANRMFMGFFVLHGMWMQAVWPVYSELIGKKEFGKMKQLVKENCLYGVGFIGIVTLTIALSAPFLCQLFFSHEQVEIPLSLIGMLGSYYLIRALCDPYATALQSMNYLKPLLIAVFCQAAVSWLGQTLFVGVWGVYGIVLGLICSYLATVSWALPRGFYQQMKQRIQLE